MRKLMKNNFFFSFSILMGLTLFFASCSRQQGAVSYHSDKLQKQSEEIENSIYTYSQSSEEVKTTESQINNENSLAKTQASTNEATNALTSKGKIENKKTKLSMAEKLLVKKLNKKLNPQEKLESKRSGGDDMLKKSLLVMLIGLAVLLVGGIVNVGIIELIGAIILVVGLVIFILWAVENL